MKLSIIILNYHSEKLAESCLSAVFEYPPKCLYEVVVVDNNEKLTGQYSELKNKWDNKVKFISSGGNAGYARGNEVGINNSVGEYFVIINPDVLVSHGTLERMVEFMDNNPKTGIVGPQLVYPDGLIQDSYRNFPNILDQIIKRIPVFRSMFKKRMFRYLNYGKNPQKTETVDWIVGACWMFRREFFDKVSGFSGNYTLFMDDPDVCFRMWQHGYSIYYLAEAKVLHNHARLSAGGFMDFFRKKTLRIHTYDAIRYFFRHAFQKNPRIKF